MLDVIRLLHTALVPGVRTFGQPVADVSFVVQDRVVSMLHVPGVTTLPH
ncbi:MAG: hypothetical protein WKH97_15330 [Casimicrobiaceae bacterium]